MIEEIGVDCIWKFFYSNLQKLRDQMLRVAYNTDTGAVVYITEEHFHPCFVVELNGNIDCEQITMSKVSCEEAYREILSEYSTPAPDDEGETELSKEDLDRNDELSDAAYDFISVLVDGTPEDFGLDLNDLDSVIGHVGIFLSEEYGISIRHPTVLELEDGSREVIQYPYGE